MKSTYYSGKHALVIGLGMSGRSAAHFLMAHGATVQGVDRDFSLLQTHAEVLALKRAGMSVRLDQDSLDVTHFDLVVLSPGVSQTHPLVTAARKAQVELIGEIELGCRTTHQPVIGITGTNGKTTVTLLVTHVLKQNGYLAKALGNVGVPFTQELLGLHPQETIVLELSSYQLETLQQRVLEQAVILNVTPDHLDRYASMDAYAAAKFGMERCLKSEGVLFIEEKAMQEYGHLQRRKGAKTYGYNPDCFIYTDLYAVFREGKKAFELPSKLRGRLSHDVENLLAAYAICAERGLSGEQFLWGLDSFKKPAHRIEFVLEKDGVYYYDDSKGTNIDAVIRAVQCLDGPLILIAGGVDKGAAYTPWLEAFKDKVKQIYAIGQAAPKMQEQLASHLSVTILTSLDQAVQEAAKFARKGDTVLLSPGCSSYDMFRDYAHRGEEFQRAVRQL